MRTVERLTVSLLQRDKEALRRLAKAEGEAMAVVLRRLIRQAAKQLVAEEGRDAPTG